MKKSEKQIILGLAAVILVFAAVFGVTLMKNQEDSGADNYLREAMKSDTSEDSDISTPSEETDASNDAAYREDLVTQEAAEEPVEDTRPEVTAAEENKTEENVMDSEDGYMFPASDTSYLSSSDLEGMSAAELQYAINEIYARHGLKFTKQENKERFGKKRWYQGTVDDQDSISLNTYEKKNIDMLANKLKKKGAR